MEQLPTEPQHISTASLTEDELALHSILTNEVTLPIPINATIDPAVVAQQHLEVASTIADPVDRSEHSGELTTTTEDPDHMDPVLVRDVAQTISTSYKIIRVFCLWC